MVAGWQVLYKIDTYLFGKDMSDFGVMHVVTHVTVVVFMSRYQSFGWTSNRQPGGCSLQQALPSQ